MINYRKYYDNNKLDEFCLYKYHDACHMLRVLVLSLLLCCLLNVDENEVSMVAVASLYHDVGRQNDDFDYFHGIKSWKRAKDVITNDFCERDWQTIKFIIENHCIPDKDVCGNIVYYACIDKEKTLKLLNIMKDADSLDITRFDCFNEKYLRFEQSKALIPVAKSLVELNSSVTDVMKIKEVLTKYGYEKSVDYL